MKTFLLPHVFNEFKDKIITSSYYPANPLETLKARLTAIWLHRNSPVASQAEAFLHRTSASTETLSDLQQLADQTGAWGTLHVCSSYTNTRGTFLEYKLSFILDNQEQTMHFHAQYEIKERACYFVSQTVPLIRVIGDPVLHRPGILFPKNPTLSEKQELATQIECAKSILVQTSGAGIAANQCATIKNPYRFTIVGVFYDIPEHVNGVERRYPNTRFPQARIMINPVITAVSKETQNFNHACLSVPCANRCEVISPMDISVIYQDPTEEMGIRRTTMSGVDAVVLWHELTHILFGKTYMDVTFESLPRDDLFQFQKMVDIEIQRRQKEDDSSQIPELTVPPFHISVKVNEKNTPRLDPKPLAEVLPNISDETLAGLFNQSSMLLKKKLIENQSHLTAFSFLSTAKQNREKSGNNEDIFKILSKL